MVLKHAAMGLAVAALVVVGPSVRSAEDKDGGDLKKLEGKWTAKSGDGGKVTYTFKGKKLKIEAPSREYAMTVTLDAAAKPEKTIDFKIDEAPDDAKGKTSKGIYKIDGEKLTICTSAPGKDRPKEFAQVEDESYLFAMKKQK
jgi:uncharacterized protein (TIGR03067 family)